MDCLLYTSTVLILGAGPTGICTLLCVMLHSPKRIIVCEKDENRLQFIRQHYPQVLTVQPEDCAAFVRDVYKRQVYKQSNISRQHFSKIQCNRDYNPKKKTVLAFAVGLHLFGG